MTDEQRKIEISWVQAMADALAAVSSAVLLSTVGVAGTIIGAAVGSVAATVGSTVYSHYLAVSRDRVAAAAAARSRVRRAQADLGDAAADLATGDRRAEDRLDDAENDLQKAELRVETVEQEPASARWRAAFSGLPWRRLLLAAAGLFVAAMVVIVTFELISGRAVSSYTGGSDRNGPRTSVPGLGDDKEGKETPEPSPTPVVSDTATPTGPSVFPTAAPTGTSPPSVTTSPSETPSPSPSSTTPTTGSSTPTTSTPTG